MLASELKIFLNKPVNVKQATQIHAQILFNGLRNLESCLVRQITCSEFSCARIVSRYLQRILRHSQNPDSFSWGCAVRFFSQNGQFMEAISHFVQMQRLGLHPSTFAVSSTLRACGRITCKFSGSSVHAQVYKLGFCRCVYVQTALVDFYSKLGDMGFARKVFDDMTEKNVVSWNSILSGYVKIGNLDDAQKVFDEMPVKDVISWNSMLTGFANSGNMDRASCLFQQLGERSSASWNAMISGYVNCGDMKSARNMFDEMPNRNNVSWITLIAGYSKLGEVGSACELFNNMGEKEILSYNAMIACYSQNGMPNEALKLFNQMLQPHVNIQPDEMTFASIISACTQLGNLNYGAWIESYMEKLGIELDDHLATALVDFYAKSGNIERAFELFNDLKKKDLVSYSAMIFGCGINGKAFEAIRLFEEMLSVNICPNLVTYAGLLTSYNHAGLVDEGYVCFLSMKDHGLEPLADHYGIMVDLLGRAGRLEEAHELIQSMPVQPNAGVWGALLHACRLHNNVELGEIAARNCSKLVTDTTGYRSLLANIYSSVERWDDAKRLRKAMGNKVFAKISGCSWMEQSEI
ncbi:pentatricopeptide repeat-containing protein At4g22760 [Cucurbita pepo subsp. pepo]|uniref:pentatricopeptide repeat-containing protein At4g22760 n=1 Tax=Cucurbita pepo subsp. pepo TaxID=3664 RepID=UPI000C9D59C5|nr:pentatricopeptide repeat-containing protein At4g22760 [Cucurbita pepo subsp. pepo]